MFSYFGDRFVFYMLIQCFKLTVFQCDKICIIDDSLCKYVIIVYMKFVLNFHYYMYFSKICRERGEICSTNHETICIYIDECKNLSLRRSFEYPQH